MEGLNLPLEGESMKRRLHYSLAIAGVLASVSVAKPAMAQYSAGCGGAGSVD
jgi:hypothetical protein